MTIQEAAGKSGVKAARIPLSQGKYALVDIEDFQQLMKHGWFYGNRGYAVRHSPMVNGKRKKIYMHRAIMRVPQGKEIDHINKNRIDNRRENLRICTRAENLHNQGLPKNNRSGIKGVCFIENPTRTDKHWQATIGLNGTRIWLGSFLTKKEAKRARIEAELNLYGEFASVSGV